MARIRSVKPEFWDDRKLAKRASRDARLLYIALWNLADEHGRLNGDPQWIKGQVFSYDDDLNADSIAALLAELEGPAVGAVVAYEVDGDPYLFLPKLARHQRLEPEKVRSRLPAPPATAFGPDEPEPTPPSTTSPPEPSESRADHSASHADELAPDPEQSETGAGKSALLYVAGGMEHVAGSREQGAGPRAGARARAAPAAPPTGLAEIPDDFRPTEAMLRWANATYPGLDLDFETAQFCRHWRSEGRRKKSWPDAWQKWIADSHSRAQHNSRASPAHTNPRSTTNERVHQAIEAGRRVQAMLQEEA